MSRALAARRYGASRAMRAPRSFALPRRQHGVVLFIALIVLVAMTMAGVAIMRSVDTSNLISGNVAFKQSTLQAADSGAAAAINYLVAQQYTGQLDSSTGAYKAVGYDASNEPDWSDDASWANSVVVGTTNGNKVEYVINRLCQLPGTVNTNNCAKLQATGGAASQCLPGPLLVW